MLRSARALLLCSRQYEYSTYFNTCICTKRYFIFLLKTRIDWNSEKRVESSRVNDEYESPHRRVAIATRERTVYCTVYTVYSTVHQYTEYSSAPRRELLTAHHSNPLRCTTIHCLSCCIIDH